MPPGTNTIGNLLIKLGIDIQGVASGMSQAEKELESSGTRMYFLGSRIAIGFGAPIAAAVAIITKFGLEFDSAMTESLAIMKETQPEIRREMEMTARTVSESTKFSSAQAATAYYNLASAGMDAKESMAALPVVARFAQAGVMDLSKATDLLVGSQVALGLRIKNDAVANMVNLTRVSDVLTAANNEALGTVEEFAEALTNKAGASLRHFSKDVEEGTAVLMAYAEQNVRGRVAGNQLYILMRDLQRASMAHVDTWKKLNVEVFDATGTMRNMADIIGDLEKALDGMSDRKKRATLEMMGFRDRSVAATLALVGMSDEIRRYEGLLRSAGGATEEVANKQMMALANQMARIKNEYVNALIDLFYAFAGVVKDTLLPALEAGASMLKDFAQWVRDLPEWVKVLISAVAGLGVALGPLIVFLGSMKLAIAGLLASNGLVAMLGEYTAKAGIAVKGTVALSGSLTGLEQILALVTNPIFLAGAALTALGVAIYYDVKAHDTLRREMEGGEAAFNKHTTELEKSLAVYDAHRYGASESAKAEDELKAAVKTLAAELGTTPELFDAERGASNLLTDALREQMRARRELQTETANQKRSEIASLQSQIQDAHDEIERIQSPNSKYVAAVDDYGRMQEETYSPTQKRAEIAKLLAQISAAQTKLETTKAQYASVVGARTGDISLNKPGPAGPLPPLDNTDTPGKVDAHAQKIADLVDQMQGDGKKKYDEFAEAFGHLTAAEKENVFVSERVWNIYKGLRDELLVLNPEIEKTVAQQVRQAAITDKVNFFQTNYGEYIHAMRGVNDEVEKLHAAMPEVVREFEDQGKAMDPAFFAKYGDTLEQVGLIYHNDLTPAMFEVIEAYHKWKDANEAANGEVNKSIVHMQQLSLATQTTAAKMTADLIDKRDELKVFSLGAADAEFLGLKKGLEKQRLEFQIQGKAMMDSWQFFDSEHVKDEIAKYFKFRQEADQFMKYEELIGLTRLAKQVGVTDRMIRNFHNMTEKEIQDLIRLHLHMIEVEETWKDIRDVASGMQSIFAALGLDAVADAFKTAGQAADGFFTGMKTFRSADGNLAQEIAGIEQMAASVLQLGQQMSQMANKAKRVATGALGGAQVGAGVGFMVGGPVGAAIGAGIGASVGALAGLLIKPAFSDIMKRVGKSWGVTIGEELAKQIQTTAKNNFHGDRMAAELFNMKDIIAAAGGLTAGNFDTMLGKLHDVFTMLGTGMFTLAQARKVIDDNFTAFADHMMKTKAIATPAFLEILNLAKSSGINSDAVNQFYASQSQKGGTAASKVLQPMFSQFGDMGNGDLRKQIEDARKAVSDSPEAGSKLIDQIEDTQNKLDKLAKAGKQDSYEYADATAHLIALKGQLGEKEKLLLDLMIKQKDGAKELGPEIERVGRLVMAEVVGALRSGVPILQVFEDYGDGLDKITSLWNNLGLTSDNVALRTIAHFREMVKGNKDLVDAASGLNDIFTVLSYTGGLNIDTLKDLEDQGLSTFDKLKNAGFTDTEALMVMKDWLGNVKKAHEDLGVPIDENTQKLIDQATEQGILKDDGMDMLSVMIDGFSAMILALGGTLPAAWETYRKKAESANKDAKSGLDDATVAADNFARHLGEITPPDWNGFNPDFPDSSDNPPAEVSSTGSLVTRSGLRHLGRGGRVGFPGGPVGSDTVPAWLTPTEVVLNVAQQRNVASAISSPKSVVFENHNHFNGPTFAKQQHIEDEIAEPVIDAIALKFMTKFGLLVKRASKGV